MSTQILAVGLALVAVAWTVLPFLRHDAWWIRVFDFPRVQGAVLTAAVAAAYAALAGWDGALDKAILAVLGLCVAYQGFWVLRFTPLYPKQVLAAPASGPDNHLAILTANVLTPNRNADAFLKLVRATDPDVIVAVETDAWWQSRLDALEADYPHAVKQPLDNLYGMHLYSRLPLEDPQVRFLVEDGVPSIHTGVVLRSGHRVALHALHPAPPSPTENPTSAERDAELLMVAKAVAGDGRSRVVVGDLNDVAWSATTRLFQKISGLLDPRVGRGLFNTFHAQYPVFRWPLDHVFCSPDFTVASLARLGDIGSDHFPIHAVLCHTPAARDRHDVPRADAADEALAEEKIVKVNGDAPETA